MAVICAPGNAGIARAFPVTEADPLDVASVLAAIANHDIDLTVVGAEAPLALGIVDRLTAAGHLVFGPTSRAAQLETSKAFAKDFMHRHDVPTARYRVCALADEALDVIRSGEFGDQLVVKADGLAAGKGVVVADDRAEAERAVKSAMLDRAFGDAGSQIVIEERLSGPEVSFFVVADGERYVTLLSAQDHKRVFDHDEGPNTGGMGAFAPSPLLTAELRVEVERRIVRPVLHGMVHEGAPFRGFLYCGLMLTVDGPKVIEFNVRFGDPEAQVVLPLLDRPLAPLLFAAASGQLVDDGDQWPVSGAAVGVVLASKGYPAAAQTGDVIAGLGRVAADCPEALLFFGGVAERQQQLVTAGGRVVTVVARDATFAGAIARAYDAVSGVHFDGMHYRRDIGRKALESIDVG
jgi:phosphoribosylamine---glycine ligase